MAYPSQVDKNRSKLVAASQYVSQPSGACPIPSGSTGHWNDNGAVKLRNADGTDAPVLLTSSALRFLAFAGKNGAGACTLTGAKVGDTVAGVVDLAGASASAAASFETVITVANQIQQTSASNLSAVKYAVILGARS